MGNRKAVLLVGVWEFLLLVAVFGVVLNVRLVWGSGTIYIRADGSIDPPTAPIFNVGNVSYTFTDNIEDSIYVQRSNIIIDGAGFMIQSGYGFILDRMENVTIKNVHIKTTDKGIYVLSSSNITILGNTITNNDMYGIHLLSSVGNIVSGNTITSNGFDYWRYGSGIFVEGSSNNTISGNTVTNNGAYEDYWRSGGVSFEGSSHNSFFGNNIANNKGYGVGFSESSYNIFSENSITNNHYHGVYLRMSSNYNNTISGNNIRNSGDYGVYLNGGNYNTLSENIITNNGGGACLDDSDSTTVSRNNITDNTGYGVYLIWGNSNNISKNNITSNDNGVYFDLGSDDNIVSNNSITNNDEYGVGLSWSENNVFRNNSVAGSRYNFGVEGNRLSNFIQDVDLSNTVDGKPVYYWVNRQNMEVPSDAGYVALINSHNITAKGLKLENNIQGMLLAYMKNSHITNNNIANNTNGIELYESSNNTISGNTVTNNDETGIYLHMSSNNTIHENNITNHYSFGGSLRLWMSNNSVVFGNTIANSQYGVWLYLSSRNKFYHNNFIENTWQSHIFESLNNTWDLGYPSGGNYWSDYIGVDEKSGPNQDQPGSDGIGDTPYTIDVNNTDRYPLMIPIDEIPPITIHDYDGFWHTKDFTINLTATDNLSGVAETYYKINDDSIQNVTAHGQPRITTESANNTLEYWSVDKRGNEEIPYKILIGIKLDKTAPLGAILINTDDANTTTPNVTLNLWASDTTSGVSQMRFSNDETNWTTWETYATSKAWNLSLGEGIKTVYVQYKNVAGLISPAYNDTITLLDEIPPLTTINLSGAEGDNNWFTSNVTITLSATDEISEVDKTEYSFDNSTWTTYMTPFNVTKEGSTIIYYKSTDKAGNVEKIKTETIKIDKTVPSGSLIINNDATWTASTSVTLTLASTDNTSGVYQVRYSNDGVWDTEPWETPSSAKTWTLTLGDGTKTVYYQIKDNSGLISDTYSDTIILDTSPPTGSISINDGAAYTTTITVTLTLSATDETSGIAEMRFSNDNIIYIEWQTYDTSKSWTLQDEDGIKTVYVQFRDKAGLISTHSDSIILDTHPPSGSILIAEGSAYTNTTSVTLTLTADDETASVAQMRFSNNGIDWSNWEPYATSKAWSLSTGDGTKTVHVQFMDNAGLISQSYQDPIILDTTKPTANAGQDQTVSVGVAVSFDAGASTDNVGIVSYEWDFGDGTTGTGATTSHLYSAPDTYTVTLTVRDAADNSATHSITITVKEAETPPPPPTEAFPMWIIGAAVATAAIVAAVTAFFWKKRK